MIRAAYPGIRRQRHHAAKQDSLIRPRPIVGKYEDPHRVEDFSYENGELVRYELYDRIAAKVDANA